MPSMQYVLVAALACAATGGLRASVPGPAAEQPPTQRLFDSPVVPLPGGSVGGGVGGRSTGLVRQVDVSVINSITTVNNTDGSAPTNTVLELLFPPGTQIQGYGYDAAFTYIGTPANPDIGFRLFNSDNASITAAIDVTSNNAMLDLAPAPVAEANWITLPDGRLGIEFFEAVDDRLVPGPSEPDGTWTSGNISILYSDDSAGCCIWDNGDFDNRGGTVSQVAPLRPPPPGLHHVTADDFYLEPNFAHMIEWMEAVFIVSNPLSAYNFDAPLGRLEIFTDCNGAPGEEIAEFPIFLPRDGFLGEITTGVPGDVWRVVAETPGLCLIGGKPYWASFVMFGDQSQGGTDVWYWGTTGSPSMVPPYDPPLFVKGALPHFQDSEGAEWERLSCSGPGACIGCSDLNFCVQGERCKIVLDASTFKAPPQPAGLVIAQYGARSVDLTSTLNQARAADDVTISPCETDPVVPCLIEAYIWTNCTPAAARLEIYETACLEDPERVQPADEPLDFDIVAGPDDAEFLGLTIDAPIGPDFRLFRFKFTEFDGFTFESGKTYWIAAAGIGSPGPNNDAYFAFAAPRCPEDECYRLGNEGFAMSDFPSSTYPDWTPTSEVPGLLEANDFAMLIAVRNGGDMFTNGAVPVCIADFDGSGQVGVADIFSFLSEWFSGCP